MQYADRHGTVSEGMNIFIAYCRHAYRIAFIVSCFPSPVLSGSGYEGQNPSACKIFRHAFGFNLSQSSPSDLFCFHSCPIYSTLRRLSTFYFPTARKSDFCLTRKNAISLNAIHLSGSPHQERCFSLGPSKNAGTQALYFSALVPLRLPQSESVSE